MVEHGDGAELVGLARQWREKGGAPVVALRLAGELRDLPGPVPDGAEVELVAVGSEAGLEVLRHSTSHVLALAVGRLFPGVKFGIGPAIEAGFYYDFDVPGGLREEDLPRIEEEMRRIVAEDLPFQRTEVSLAEAREMLERSGQGYKLELLGRAEGALSFYRLGEFVDYCRGPHLPRSSDLAAFKLTSLAGSYWLGRVDRPMLQRVYGLAFATQEELDAHLHMLEEAKARDHRVLGRELELYSTHDEFGPGLIFFHPKGGLIRYLIEEFWRTEHLKRGYQMVFTPHIASEAIFRRSGHLEKYADLMYSPMDIDGVPYYIRPMNCPGHILIYQNRPRSYRELPLRLCELGTVYRYEPSGTLHGLFRVRGFTQDDAHIFCTPEQLPAEIEGVLELADFMMKAFGFRYRTFLATRPEKYLGTEEEWDRATAALRAALEKRRLDYEVDEGKGVFYAPKIDIKLADSLGREEWQGPTIQVDLNLPKRFGVTYVGEDNTEHEVIMVHRTVIGSMERFLGNLIEHFAGAFPMWLAPVQVAVIPITDDQRPYAGEVAVRLRQAGLRVDLDERSEKVGYKIRSATLQKVPYMLIIGKREVEAGTVALRARLAGDLGSWTLERFIERATEEVATKALPEGMAPLE
jgi:threonyl-tRNA synthetase